MPSIFFLFAGFLFYTKWQIGGGQNQIIPIVDPLMLHEGYIEISTIHWKSEKNSEKSEF